LREYLVNNFNPILLVFASYTIGVIGTGLIKISGQYDRFENHNYMGDKLTSKLGVLKFGWLIRNSFMGLFNPKLRFKGKLNRDKLIKLKNDMTFAENNHLVGFLALQSLIFMLAIWGIEIWEIITYTLINIVFNLYIVFLQQYNKRRIDKILSMNVERE